MTESPDLAFLAIDGGGTRCRFALCLGNRRHDFEGGSANVSSDFDGSVACIRDGAAQLAGDAGLTPEGVLRLPAFVGLAGVTGRDMVARLRTALDLTNAQIADDRPAALRGALGAADGVLAHCGTGSFFAAQKQGEMYFAGGWGWVLGDEASAQWVGRRLLAMTLRCVDGHSSPSSLSDTMLDKFGGPAGIVGFAGKADPLAFGALAPLVTEAAARGDETAISIMRDAAKDIDWNLRKMGWAAPMPICLTGGIGPSFAPYLPDEMQSAITPPKNTPIDGAIALAQAQAAEAAYERH